MGDMEPPFSNGKSCVLIFFFTGNGDISLIKELLRTSGIPLSLLFRNSQYLHGIKDLVLVGFHVLNLSLCTAQVFCFVY
jgi:hypothetical protein